MSLGLNAFEQIWPNFRTWSGSQILDQFNIDHSKVACMAPGDIVLKCPWEASKGQATIQFLQGGSLADHERCWSHVTLFIGQGKVIDAQMDRTPRVKLQTFADFLNEDLDSHYRFRRHTGNRFTIGVQQALFNQATDISESQTQYNTKALFRPLAGAKGACEFKVTPGSVDCSELAALLLSKAARISPFTSGAALAPSPAAFAISAKFADYDILL